MGELPRFNLDPNEEGLYLHHILSNAVPQNPKLTSLVLASVMEERARQDAKWGEQNHSLGDYLMIAAEEDGEAAKEAVELTFGTEGPGTPEYKEREKRFLTELIEAIAVRVAIAEMVLRKRGVSRGTAGLRSDS